jgi:3-oxoacyl-[acyl-carrier protein] reductase
VAARSVSPQTFTVREKVERAVAEVTKELGPPDIAIANVDGPGAGSFAEVSEKDFASSINKMAMSVVYVARAVLPHMRRHRRGRIIAINSMSAKEPESGRVMMALSRAAVVALSKSLSDEFAGDGITVNSVGMGWFRIDRMIGAFIATAERQRVTFDDVLSERIASLPAKRLGKPEGMAAVLAFPVLRGGRVHHGRVHQRRRRIPPQRLLNSSTPYGPPHPRFTRSWQPSQLRRSGGTACGNAE